MTSNIDQGSFLKLANQTAPYFTRFDVKSSIPQKYNNLMKKI